MWLLREVWGDFHSSLNCIFVKNIIPESVKDNNNKPANALKEVKHLCKEFGFTGILEVWWSLGGSNP